MGVISIKTVSKILEKNAMARKMFQWGIKATLFLLEQQRLIDHRKIEKVTVDWEKKTLNLGDDFTSMLIARAFGEYVVDRVAKKKYDDWATKKFKIRSKGDQDYHTGG